MATIRGTNRNDVLIGTENDDTLIGRRGNDSLKGRGGDDVLRGGEGADRLNGGAGDDWADYRGAATGVTVSLSNRFLNTGEAAGDRYNSIERIFGSQFDDTLIGNDLNNVLDGGAGGDLLNGGGGFDFARYKGALSGVTASLANPSVNTGDAAGDTYVSIEGLQGSNFADSLTGDATSNVLIGGRGGDLLDGGNGFDFARYEIRDISRGVVANLADASANQGDAAGDTYVSIEGVVGTRFADRLTGNDVANVLRGEAGHDRLNGGLGNDSVYGGAGNDRLDGGYGNDFLFGASGEDTFLFTTTLNATENVDFIQGFSVKHDTIRLDDAIFTAIGSTGTLKGSAFYTGASAHDASDRIVYDRATGALYYDPDGTGSQEQIQFAQLSAKLALTKADIFVF
jgi:serralysin